MKRFFYNTSLLIIIVAIASTSCKKNKSTPAPIPIIQPAPVWDVNALRGTWVTTAASNALESRDNIKACVQNCKTANINNIFMVVYNNGTTCYPSTIMQNLIGVRIRPNFAGRDPLQEMIEEAHAVGIKVHAWFEYGFSSSFSNNGGSIIAARPTWAAKDRFNRLVVKNGFDWLNAFDPAVQQYMVNLFKEVTTNYDIDGVQGDDRLPAQPNTAGYDSYTSNLYFTETGLNPPNDSLNTIWVQWRAKKLNGFLKRLRTEVKAIKPNILFSMSPSPYPFSLTEYLQDWPTWVDSAWVDAVLPQCYRYDIAAYNATLAQQKTYYRNPAVPFYPGIIVKSGATLVSDDLLRQEISKNRASGFKGECFFFYEGVKDKVSFFQGQYPFIQ
jgi:uncharacterized lipoprotein YddW (UPF0748 family)